MAWWFSARNGSTSGIGGTTGDSIPAVALTRRQRNELFETLSKKGIDAADCRPDVRGLHLAVILHLPTRSWFKLTVEPTRYVLR
jgi:hypothetical protein